MKKSVTPPTKTSPPALPKLANVEPNVENLVNWDDIVGFLLTFPDTELTTTWNNPAIKTGGRLVAWWRDATDSPESIALKVDPSEKLALIADPNSPFYTIEHFEKTGTQAVLVQPELVPAQELQELLTEAWRLNAKARVRRDWEAQQ